MHRAVEIHAPVLFHVGNWARQLSKQLILSVSPEFLHRSTSFTKAMSVMCHNR